MQAMMLQGFRIRMIDLENTTKDIQETLGGRYETITLRDGGHMLCDQFALAKDKPYNSLASLIAGTGVYGDAIIVGADGDGFCDIPDTFLALLNFPEDYFKSGDGE